MKVINLRLVVYRQWGQISVKDMGVIDFTEVTNYVHSTWKDVIKFKVKVERVE